MKFELYSAQSQRFARKVFGYFLKIFRYIPCWPVNVPHSTGGSTPTIFAVSPATRLPDPGVRTRLSPVVHTPVAATGWPIVVVTKSSLIKVMELVSR